MSDDEIKELAQVCYKVNVFAHDLCKKEKEDYVFKAMCFVLGVWCRDFPDVDSAVRNAHQLICDRAYAD